MRRAGWSSRQKPDTAKFDGMPKNAIDTGVVDYIAPPEAIPEAILANLDRPGERAELTGIGASVSEEGMNALFRILRDECGIDFSHYKQSTVLRRVEQRLQLIQAIDLDDDACRFREDPNEVNSLYHDLLIGVTEFFRDAEEFERLERDVIPQLLDRHRPGEELQATNEELVASNEELQSTNEELHSVNEELYTVNAEHQRKISQLTQLTNDMDNLLQSIDVGTIFLDRDLCIRKFTPRITDVFHILPQDIGRRTR